MIVVLVTFLLFVILDFKNSLSIDMCTEWFHAATYRFQEKPNKNRRITA